MTGRKALLLEQRAPQIAGNGRPEFQDPAPNGLAGHVNATFGQQLLDMPVAQREPQMQPESSHSVAWICRASAA